MNLRFSRHPNVRLATRQPRLQAPHAQLFLHQAAQRLPRPEANQMRAQGRGGAPRPGRVHHDGDDDADARCAEWWGVCGEDADVYHVGGSDKLEGACDDAGGVVGEEFHQR